MASGYAAACKAVYAGSIPASASITGGLVHYEDNNGYVGLVTGACFEIGTMLLVMI